MYVFVYGLAWSCLFALVCCFEYVLTHAFSFRPRSQPHRKDMSPWTSPWTSREQPSAVILSRMRAFAQTSVRVMSGLIGRDCLTLDEYVEAQKLA